MADPSLFVRQGFTQGAEWVPFEEFELLFGLPTVNAAVFLAADGTGNSTSAVDALVAYMDTIAGTNPGARYPKLGARPLLITPGDYRATDFTDMPLWGDGASVVGQGPTSILDNIGISVLEAFRGVQVANLTLGKRDRVVVPDSYGVRLIGASRMGRFDNVTIYHRETGILLGDERVLAIVGASPGQNSFTTPMMLECGTGIRTNGGCYNQIAGGWVIACTDYALDVYCGPVGRVQDIFLGGRKGNIRLRAASRGASTDSYLLDVEAAGGPDLRQIPILSVTDDGGLARFVLSTSLAATVATHDPVTWWDPVQHRAYIQCRALGTITAGQIDQISVGGVDLLSAAIPWAGSTTLTLRAAATNINADSDITGWMAFVPVSATTTSLYIDSVEKDDDGTLGQVVVTTVSGGFDLTPDPVIAINTPTHAYTVDDVKDEIEFNYDGDIAIVQGSINATTLTITRIWVGASVPLNVPFTGPTVTTARTITAVILANADGTGTYTINAGAGVQPSQVFTIGRKGVCPIRAIDGDDLLTDMPENQMTPAGNVTGHFRIFAGMNQVEFWNGATPVQIDSRLNITEVDAVSILTDLPFASVPVLDSATIRCRGFDSDYCAMDTSANRLNDVQNTGGNRNVELHRSSDHVQYTAARLKTEFWIDDRANPNFQTTRMVIYRSGRGRSNIEEDTTGVTPIAGAPRGWCCIEGFFGDLNQPEFEDGIQIVVPNPTLPMINNIPQTNRFRVSGLFARVLLGDNSEIINPTTLIKVPVTGQTIEALAGDRVLLTHPATIAALAIVFGPANNGESISITAQEEVTVLTLTGTGADTVVWTPGPIDADTPLKFTYFSSILSWQRSV